MANSALRRAATSACGMLVDDERGDRQRVGRRGRAEQADARRWRRRRRAAACARRASCAAIAGQPMRWQLARGGGEGDARRARWASRPPRARAGRSRRPRRGRRGRRRRRRPGTGRRRSNAARGPISAPAPNGAYILCPLHATKSAVAGSGRCGASWAASTSTGTPRAWAAAMISSIGGSQPVTFDAPVIASSRGAGRGVERLLDRRRAGTCRRGSHSTKRRRRDARPRQQVGVVLDDGGHDDVAAAAAGGGRRGG